MENIPDTETVDDYPTTDDNNTQSHIIDDGNILSTLKTAVNRGQLTKHQAKELRRKVGFNESYFTKKQLTANKRKLKNKQQKQSRRANRKK